MSPVHEGLALARQVPAFDAAELRERASSIAVVVFVINEGAKIQQQLRAMQPLANRFDVIVADGGSTDGSLEPAFLAGCGVRGLLTKRGPGKLSAQMRMAFAYCLDQGYDGVITIDGNGKDDVSAIPDFAALLEAGVDHVQGSRFIPGGRAINTPLSRWLAVRLLHAPLISLAAGERHTDTTNGFRAYSRRLLEDPEIAVFRDVFVTYELHYHLAIESSRAARFRTAETPVTRAYPAKGKVPTKISPVRGNAMVFRLLLNAVRGRYRQRAA